MSHLLSDHPEMAVPLGDTPRTDANEQSVMDNGYSNGGYTDSDFSRQLEIGLAAAMKELAALRAQLAEARKENDTLRGLLGNSAKPCPYCGLAAEDQAKCQQGFPGCSRADDQMLSKHFADAYRAEQAEAQLAKALEENARLNKWADDMTDAAIHAEAALTELRQHAEENARLKERVALDDAEREYRRQSLANEIRETLKVRGHFAAERPSDLIGCVARAIESERDRANRAEAELAKLRQAIELAARAMGGEGVNDQGEAWDKCLRILDAARDAYPKED